MAFGYVGGLVPEGGFLFDDVGFYAFEEEAHAVDVLGCAGYLFGCVVVACVEGVGYVE